MLTESIRTIYTTNLGVRKSERVLVCTDRIRESEIIDAVDRCRRERLRDIALLIAEIGKSFAGDIVYAEYPATLSHGSEPHEELWRLAFGEKTIQRLAEDDLLTPLLSKEITDSELKRVEHIIRMVKKPAVHAVIALSNFSTSHTRFRDLLTRTCRCRYASMPLFDISMFEGAMSVDWRALSRKTAAIARMVDSAVAISIKTPNGTSLTLSKKGRRALPDTGMLTRPGAFGNLPAGEVYLAPCEGTAAGTLVLNWAPTHELSSPIVLTVENGLVVSIAGEDPYVRVLKAKLSERKENANIAELGIGTNDKATRPDNILESEKILGTIHVALGDNSSFGGCVKTPFHQDFVFFKPTVKLIYTDRTRKTLLREGRLIDEV